MSAKAAENLANGRGSEHGLLASLILDTIRYRLRINEALFAALYLWFFTHHCKLAECVCAEISAKSGDAVAVCGRR
jgi:hypothetical protein